MRKEYQAWLYFHHIYDVISGSRDAELRRLGVTIIQAGVISILATVPGPLIPMRIAELTGRRPHSISELLVRMEKSGLVKRTRDLDRRNQIRVTLTAKGWEKHRQISHIASIRYAFSPLSAAEIEMLIGLLKKIKDDLSPDLPHLDELGY